MFELIVGITVILIILYMPYLLLKMIYEAYLIKTGKSKRQKELTESWRDFDKRQIERDHARKRRDDETKKSEEIKRNHMLKKAENLIQRNKFKEAIDIYDTYGHNKLVEATLRKQAYLREKALDYDSAIEIWEKLDEIEEAVRVRKLKVEQGTVKVTQKVVHGDEVTKTEIKDSVLNRSNVGGKSKGEEIKEIKELLDSGAIDNDEFKQMKKEILGK